MIKIRPLANAKSIWGISEDALYYKNNEDIACPWDADIVVEGDKVIIEGSIGGSDASTYTSAGYCRCECSVNNFTKFYNVEVPDDTDTQKIEDAGWAIVE